MPVLEGSSFAPPLFLRSSAIQTVIPAVFRAKTHSNKPRFETLSTEDGDILELAWFGADTLNSQPPRVAVITHGLEGSINSGYVVGLTRKLLQSGYLTLAWNMRGCGGRPNRLPSWYHSGKSEDLRAVVAHIVASYPNSEIVLIGISVGGNILAKYLGEEGLSITQNISKAVAVSAPLDLRGSAQILARSSRRIYMEYLLRPLRARIIEKSKKYPELIASDGLADIKSFDEFDKRYTAPIHGFKSVDHYWDSSSGISYLSSIRVPILIVSSLDDPFLSPECFPFEQARNSSLVFLETPKYGGHVGFIENLYMRDTWLERRVLEFTEM